VQKLLENTNTVVRIENHEKIILEYIKKHGSISKSEYDKITKRARATQILDFRRLVKKGMIERINKAKATYYVLVKN
jgi:predicted HTH transcriptional regulator